MDPLSFIWRGLCEPQGVSSLPVMKDVQVAEKATYSAKETFAHSLSPKHTNPSLHYNQLSLAAANEKQDQRRTEERGTGVIGQVLRSPVPCPARIQRQPQG